MYRIVFVIIFALFSGALTAQEAQILFTFDGEKADAEQFKADCQGLVKKEDNWNFQKLVSDYADYRLEVHDALKKRLDTSAHYRQSLEYFANRLITDHVFSGKEAQDFLSEALARAEYQYKLSYIKISVPANSKYDTSMAYKKANSVKNRILGGYSFSKLARQLSDDENASFNGGNYGWVVPADFNGGRVLEDYVLAHYDDEGIAGPIRDGDYYYIVKTGGKRKTVDAVTLSVILKYKKNFRRFYNDSIRKLFAEITGRLNDGADFQALQEKYSEFPHKSVTLPLQKAYEKFSTVISDIEGEGKFSRTIETDNFFCIVRLEKYENQVFDGDFVKHLTDKFYGSEAFRYCYNKFIDSLKTKTAYKKISSYHSIYKLFPDSSVFEGRWNPQAYLGFYTETLFSIYGKNYTVGDFAQYVYDTQSQCPYDKIENYLREKYDEYVGMLAVSKIFSILKADKNFASKMRVLSSMELYKAIERRNGFSENAADTDKVYAFYKESDLSFKTSYVLKISFYDYLTDKNRKKALKFAEDCVAGQTRETGVQFLLPLKSAVFSIGDDPLADEIIRKYDSGNGSRITDFEREHLIAVSEIEKLPEDLGRDGIFPLVAPVYLQSQRRKYIEQLRRDYKLEITDGAASVAESLF